MRVTTNEIGVFVDSVAGKSRSIKNVAGRLMEEAVELGLAAGLTPQEIMTRIDESLHKQSLKVSAKILNVVAPSSTKEQLTELGSECADVGLILKDLCHVAGIDKDTEEREKFEKLKKARIVVSENGTISTLKNSQ